MGKQKDVAWGRSNYGDCGGTFGVLMIVLFTPLLVVWYWLSCTHFQCYFFPTIFEEGPKWLANPSSLLPLLPQPTLQGLQIFLAWLLFQVALFAFLPGTLHYGPPTPGGHRLAYNINGLRAWILTHALFAALVYSNVIKATIIYDNWGSLLVWANVFGYGLGIFVYLKAYLFPSHPSDRKFSGSPIYDFFFGIELNPRILGFDLKLFFNGRPGIVAWNLINVSFAAKQYELYGYVSNGMILLILLHLTYILDFFYGEDWYIATIDIAHDHFGWMLTWGDLTWLPFMYTLQSHFLVRHPVILTNVQFGAILLMGFTGYVIFRVVNNQKETFRRSNGEALIWGKKPTYIDATYTTLDGTVHKTKLLTSGFWGLSRHFNYVGDLLLSLAYCLTCGVSHFAPYFYIIFMTILLVNRTYRDDARCHGKYGKAWEEYRRRVPSKIVPYVF